MTDPFPPLPRSDRMARMRTRLLEWYVQARRDLPWRRIRDPYGIWISEAMLQQTRVATVIEYWHRFLRELPTVEALAAAPEETVLGLWSGLGYYRRARALHAAAQAIVEHHGGRFPNSREAALALPGVGEYTAGAVLSIAYDLPEAVVDGNVERVFARAFDLPGASGSGPLRRHLWELARFAVPRAGGAGDWNQALMELGATVCTAQNPACDTCPWTRDCLAKRSGQQLERPGKKAKKAPQALALESAWVVQRDRLLLRQRPQEGAMGGLWELPTRRAAASQASPLWEADWPGQRQFDLGEALHAVRHSITHHRIAIDVRRARSRGRIAPPYRWFAWDDLDGLALTGLTKKSVAQLAPEE